MLSAGAGGVDGVGDQVQHGAVDRVGVKLRGGQGGFQVRFQADADLFGPGLHQLDDIADRLIEVGLDPFWLTFFGKGKHVQNQVRNAVLITIDDTPATANGIGVPPFQPRFDQIAPAADPLQDILDVMRQGGDRLSHRRQSFTLDQCGVVERILDRQGCLVADGGDQPQVVVGELLLAARLDQLSGGRIGIDVERPDDVIATLQRHTQRLTHTTPHDRRGRLKTLIVAGVTRPNPFLSFQNVVQDRGTDGNPLMFIGRLRTEAITIAPRGGL